MHAVEHTLLAAREREYAGPSCPATEHHPHVLQSPVDFTGARTVRRKPLSSIQNVSKPLSFLRSSRACRTLSAADAARSAGLLRLLRTSQRVPNTATVPAPAIATALPRPSMSKTCCPMMMSRQADCRQLCWRIIGKTSWMCHSWASLSSLQDPAHSLSSQREYRNTGSVCE
jgi:hypothetical protein